MNDMSSAIIPKSDQINADDLIGRTMTITIRDVQIRGGQEQPVSIFFAGSDKAFRPCKSMSRVMVAAWGADANKYVGRSLTLYRDPTVKWGGMEVGGIRISHMSHLDRSMTMALTATKGSRKPFVVQPLKDAPAPAPERTGDTSGAPDDGSQPDPVEASVNEMIAWLNDQNQGRLIEGFEKKKRADIEALPPHYRQPLEKALDDAKARISKVPLS